MKCACCESAWGKEDLFVGCMYNVLLRVLMLLLWIVVTSPKEDCDLERRDRLSC